MSEPTTPAVQEKPQRQPYHWSMDADHPQVLATQSPGGGGAPETGSDEQPSNEEAASGRDA